jgi:hypothetical protein
MATKMERAACVRKAMSARFKEPRTLRKTHYKVVIKALLRWECSTLIGDMPSKITLALGTALAGIALCCFIESSLAQDALDASLAATKNDERDAEDKTIKTKNPAGIEHV